LVTLVLFCFEEMRLLFCGIDQEMGFFALKVTNSHNFLSIRGNSEPLE